MNNENKNILVIINSKSGKGKSFEVYNKFIKNYLEKENYILNEIYSKFDGHFSQYLKNNIDTIDFMKFIVVLGGDGTLHYIINDLINIDKKIPIVIIPTGSGNGLFKTITFENNTAYNVHNSLKILKNKDIKNCDLITVNNGIKKIYSSLAISWGFISDVDLKTEFLRKLGSFRFDLGAIWFLLRKKSYYGKFSYEKNDNENIIIEGHFFHFWACNCSWPSCNTCASPLSKMDDGYMYISYILLPINRCKLLSILLKMNNGEYVYDKNVKYIKTKKFSLETKTGTIVIDGEKQSENIRKIDCEVNNNYPFFC